jgi:hypothetical protein
MQRQIGTFRIAGLVLALGGCVASGGDESMLVLKAVAPPTTATGGVCMFTAMENEAGLTHGVLDVSKHNSGYGDYQFTAQLKSRIVADTTQTGQEDARTIFLRGANVDLTFPDAAALGTQIADLRGMNLLHFMSPISGALPPNGSLADAPFELIPAGVAAEFDTKGFSPGSSSTVVEATFTIVGDMAGGNASSQAFHYSVTLVKQILIDGQGPCSMVSKTFVPRTGNICNPGQDFVVDCCTDQAGNQVCPAVGTGM